MSCIPCQLTFAEVQKLTDMLADVPLTTKTRAQVRKVEAFMSVLGDTMVGREVENGRVQGSIRSDVGE
jgi:hypothetical protein